MQNSICSYLFTQYDYSLRNAERLFYKSGCSKPTDIAQWLGAVEYTDCISERGKTLPNECPRYDTKQSDAEAPVMQEPAGVRSTPSLPFLLGPLWPGVVAPDTALSMGQIELNCKVNCLKLTVFILNFVSKKRTYATLNCLK